MATRLKMSDGSHHDVGRTIPCRYGLIYAASACLSAAVFVPSPSIVHRLSMIEGVKFVAADGEYGNVLYPPIRLLEVAAVLKPIDDEPPAGAAACGGRLR